MGEGGRRIPPGSGPDTESDPASHVRFRSLIEQSMDLIMVVGPDGLMLYSSPAMARLLGYVPTELVGQDAFDYVCPDDLPVLRSAFDGASGGGQVRGSFRLYHKEGQRRSFDGVVTDLVDESTVGGFVLNLCDVTERNTAEEMLRHEQFLVDTLMEHMPDSIYFKDAESRFLRVSRPMATRLGLSDSSEAVGKTDFDVYARDHAQKAWEDEQRIIRTGQPILNKEELETWPDRPSAWVSTTKMPLRDEAGNIIGTFGISRDISERKEAELALAKSRESFASIFQMAPVAISLSNLDDGRLLDVNDEYSKLLGYERDEVVGRTAEDVGIWPDPRDRKRLVRTLAELVAVRDYGLRLRAKDGRVREVRGAFQRMELEGEAVLLATFTDITERRRAARRLEESETKFRSAFMTGADAYYIATLDEGRLLEVNDRFVELFGHGREGMVDKTSIELGLYVDPEDHERVRAQLEASGQVQSLELLAQGEDGEPIPVLLSAKRLDMDERPLILGVLRDIREQKRAAEAVRNLEEQVRQSQRLEAVGRLAGGVAHDFNNVLTAISVTSELLLADLDPQDDSREEIEVILTAAQRASMLTRQLLAFSRRQVLRPQVLDVNQVVRSLERMLPRLIGEDISLALILAEEPGAVWADPGQLEQVIVNLAVNARDAMPEGGRLTIETANVELDETYVHAHAGFVPGSHVLLAVTDSGTGMDPEMLDHIFEPFFTTKDRSKGTGLGLATVHGIVKQSGGALSVYSEPGIGTAFKIYLPRLDEPARPSESVRDGESVPGGRETLLLTEDDAHVRQAALQVLERKGYRVLVAQDGASALSVAANHDGKIHLLITDLVMPGMSGRELAERLVADRPGVQVLFMSGYTDDAVVRHGVLADGLPYLQKPFTPRSLAALVRKLLDRV